MTPILGFSLIWQDNLPTSVVQISLFPSTSTYRTTTMTHRQLVWRLNPRTRSKYGFPTRPEIWVRDGACVSTHRLKAPNIRARWRVENWGEVENTRNLEKSGIFANEWKCPNESEMKPFACEKKGPPKPTKIHKSVKARSKVGAPKRIWDQEWSWRIRGIFIQIIRAVAMF